MVLGASEGPPRRRRAEGHWEAVAVGCSSLVPTFRRGPPDESLLIGGNLGSSPPHGLWPEVLLGEAAGLLAHLRWVGLCMEAVKGQGGTDRAQSEAWGPDPPGSAAQFRPKHEVHLRASDPGKGAGTWQRKELQKRVQMRGGEAMYLLCTKLASFPSRWI